MDNLKKTTAYFDKHFARLRKIKNAQQSEIAQATRLSLEGKLSGEILDIGSGGYIDYALDNVDTLVCVDASFKSLEKSPRGNVIRYIVSDARNPGLKSNFFDRVIILHTLHHLAGDSLKETRQNVFSCLGESYRLLKKGGRIFIIDAFCSKIAQRIEDMLFNLSFYVFKQFGKPMVHYFSFTELLDILSQAGFKNISFSSLDTGKAKLCPFESSIGIPFRYTPLSHILVECSK